MINKKLKHTKLKSEWTFLDISTRKYTHAIHLYPARLHPEIPKRVISKYAKRTDVVLDPFMGSGGVLLEAILHGNNAIGIDINPFAILLSKVKTTPIKKDLTDVLDRIIKKSSRDSINKQKYPNLLPTDYDLNAWFNPKTLDVLAILKHNVFQTRDTNVRNFFKICLSLTIRKSSYQRNSAWKTHRMPADKCATFNPQPIDLFTDIARRNIQRMIELVAAKPTGIAHPILGDTRDISSCLTKVSNVLNDDKVNLMITSPPYGDHKTTVAYGQFSRHVGHWLDLPSDLVRNVDSTGLGGRKYNDMDDLGSDTLNQTLDKIHKNDLKLTKGKTPTRTKEAYAFFLDLDRSMDQISQKMAQNSHACFVVANRNVRRVNVPTDVILTELGAKYGFRVESIILRDIPNKTMPSKNAPENITNKTGSTMTREIIIIVKC